MTPITSQAELLQFCKKVEGGRFIAVDTEFLRDKTYFPKLCLLQIAGSGEAAIIDPLAPGIDLKPVFALMQKKSLTKVFHAARQDIEIFHLLSGHIPTPVFDTQIAAAVCGYGESVSYETLVNKIAGSQIDKSSRFTDWSARPLTEKQLKYAISDVTHLCDIYEDLMTKIEAAGRLSWIAEEHARLTDPAVYETDPNDAWKRLRFGHMRPKHLAALRELAKWREIEARKADVPRGRILKDDTLVELAASLPRKEADIARMRGIDRHMPKQKTEIILRCIEAALALPPEEWPQVPHRHRLPENVAAALPMLQMLLKVTADAEGIAAHMIITRDELEAVALKQDNSAMHGWRYDIFGKKAAALLNGKLKLSLNPKSGQVLIEESE